MKRTEYGIRRTPQKLYTLSGGTSYIKRSVRAEITKTEEDTFLCYADANGVQMPEKTPCNISKQLLRGNR